MLGAVLQQQPQDVHIPGVQVHVVGVDRRHIVDVFQAIGQRSPIYQVLCQHLAPLAGLQVDEALATGHGPGVEIGTGLGDQVMLWHTRAVDDAAGHQLQALFHQGLGQADPHGVLLHIGAGLTQHLQRLLVHDVHANLLEDL